MRASNRVAAGRARGWLSVVLLVLALAGAACGRTIDGEATESFGDVDPGTVAGLPVTDGPNGLRAGADPANLRVIGTDGGLQDLLAADALSDIIDYWHEQMPKTFGRPFRQPRQFESYDSRTSTVQICGAKSRGFENALYCPPDDSVAWDRGSLLPTLSKQFGPLAVMAVLAHEMGHAVQFRAADKTGVTRDTLTIVKEQQADCFAGAFSRWVATGHAKHFQMNTGTGLNRVMATMVSFRDPPGQTYYSGPNTHGSAFDRIYALQAGFAEGPARCARIDADEVGQRITQHEFSANDAYGGDLPLNEQTVGLVGGSLQQAFQPTGTPRVRLIAGNGSCSGGTGTPPVSYCPGDNTLNIDIAAMRRYAVPPARGQTIVGGQGGIGDFAALAEIASRYTLAVQKHLGIPLNDPAAGLRTTCLTGAWAGSIKQPGGPGNLLLSPGDLDEAMAELLLPRSVISADDDGDRVRSGFARIEAFRVGFLQGTQVCTQRFR